MKHTLLIVSLFIILHPSHAFAISLAPVAQTGQTTCYNASGTTIPCAGTGQDGEIQSGVAWPNPRFSDLGNGTVTDKLTGLMWTKDSNAPGPPLCGPVASKTWQGAMDYSTCLNTNSYLGFTDWRLPTIREIGGLVDTSHVYPALPTGHPFTSAYSNRYWTSSAYSPSFSNPGIYAWGFVIDHGYIDIYTEGNTYHVWPVRTVQSYNALAPTPKTGQTASHAANDDGALQSGAAWPSPRFTDNSNGTVADNLTGLVWLKNAGCLGSGTWSNALVSANSLASGDCGLTDASEVGDWHLPNKNELWSLVDYGGRSNPALTAGHPFTNVQNFSYWSSSSAGNHNWAWYVRMIYGDMYISDKANYGYYYTWPVRSNHIWSLGSLILSSGTTDFGTIQVGKTSASNQIRLRNGSSAAVSVSSVALSGAAFSQFTVAPGGTTPCASLTPTIEAGAACTLLVTATPTTTGAMTANLTITTADGSKDITQNATAYSAVLGTVTNMSTGVPLSGATVTLNTGVTTTTDATGLYNFGQLADVIYSITVSKTDYQNQTTGNLVVSSTQNSIANILLPTIGILNITTAMLPSATAGEAYSSRVMVAGGIAPYTFSKAYGNLPGGLSLDTNSGTISGTPTGSGSYTFAIGVTDKVGDYSEFEFTIDLTATLTINTTTLPRGISLSSFYSYPIAATGGKGPYTFIITAGTLPFSYTFSSSGILAGPAPDNGAGSSSIPPWAILSGDFPLTVTVTDSTGRASSKNLTLHVDSPLVITTIRLVDGRPGIAYSFSPVANGGYGVYSWSITSGTLPTGITLNPSTGIISGQTASTGSFPLNITIQDAIGRTATCSFTLSIANQLAIVTTSLPTTYRGAIYSTALQRSGGLAPFSFSAIGALPAGLSFDTTTGMISGTPTSTGYSNLSFTITDSSYPTPQAVTKNLGLRVWSSQPYTFAVTLAGNGSGTITSDSGGVACTSGTCSAEVLGNTTVKLLASPNSISLFGGWAGDCSGTGDCSLVLNNNKSITATFKLADKAKIGSTGYDSLAAAYAGAASTATIHALDSEMSDTGLTLNLGKTITLLGGYKADFSGVSGLPTLMNGALRIRNGKLTVNRLVVR